MIVISIQQAIMFILPLLLMAQEIWLAKQQIQTLKQVKRKLLAWMLFLLCMPKKVQA